MMPPRTSDDYTACIAITPSGDERRANIYRPNLMDIPTAQAALAAGRVAWIALADVPALRALLAP